MATLKDHQQAMVDLLASGSGIPASASRLAHAMHDVLAYLNINASIRKLEEEINAQNDATTPGLNDKAISRREKAVKTDSPAKWPTPAEQRVKELENTIRQLKANNAKLKDRLSQHEAVFTSAESELEAMRLAEQAGCRKPDTQVCEHIWVTYPDNGLNFCAKCGWQK